MNLIQHAHKPPTHSWWKTISLAYVPGPATPLAEHVALSLLDHLRRRGHTVQDVPGEDTNVILTTARFGEPMRWRDALLFTARRRFQLEHSPTIFTVISITEEKFREMLAYFQQVLKKDPPDPADFSFSGLAEEAFGTLYEQGKRGGPMLSLLRMIQTQTMSIRVILVVGTEHPLEAYTFDLVGAHPRSDAADLQAFYDELSGRIVTAVSTKEITDHQVIGKPIPHSIWSGLSTPGAMRQAGIELGRRNFFTEMIRVRSLTHVPSLPDSISSQYSEGCFATWEPVLEGLVATVTGSARPVDKDNLTDDELAVIVGVRLDGRGALVRHVEGKRNDPPSSEAVELMEMDRDLPRIELIGRTAISTHDVPVARSKLHGHRGVQAYDPRWIEHVYLDQPYYHFPVSCSTEAQAHAIKAAFSRSEALQNQADPRQVVFTVLPGHGIVIAEKWVEGKAPFQVMWEYMDAGKLQIENKVPQGPLVFVQETNGLMKLKTLEGDRGEKDRVVKELSSVNKDK
jgi:hypothetical protein